MKKDVFNKIINEQINAVINEEADLSKILIYGIECGEGFVTLPEIEKDNIVPKKENVKEAIMSIIDDIESIGDINIIVLEDDEKEIMDMAISLLEAMTEETHNPDTEDVYNTLYSKLQEFNMNTDNGIRVKESMIDYICDCNIETSSSAVEVMHSICDMDDINTIRSFIGDSRPDDIYRIDAVFKTLENVDTSIIIEYFRYALNDTCVTRIKQDNTVSKILLYLQGEYLNNKDGSYSIKDLEKYLSNGRDVKILDAADPGLYDENNMGEEVQLEINSEHVVYNGDYHPFMIWHAAPNVICIEIYERTFDEDNQYDTLIYTKYIRYVPEDE